MKTFRSLFPAALAATVLLLAAVTSGCDSHTAAPTAQTNPYAPSVAAATTVQTPPAAPATKQGLFTITGALPPGFKDGATVTLKALDPKGEKYDVVATTKAEQGHFTLTGSVGQPLPGAVEFAPHVYAEMIVEDGTFTLVDTGAELVVKGGHYNDQVYGYRWTPAFVAARKAANVAFDKAFAGVNPMDEKAMKAARKAIKHVFEPVQDIENDYESKILDGSADPLLKLFVLSNNRDVKRYDEAKRVAMYAEYERTLDANNPVILHMREVETMVAKSEKAQTTVGIGKPYKDVMAVDANGKQVKLSDVLAKNKLVLLDFWASWCSPCRAEFPFMSKVYKEFHGQGFEIYAVSIDVDHGEWVKALREEGAAGRIPWINLVDPAATGIDAKSSIAYGIDGVPSNFLISSDGTIVGVNMREWNLKKTVQAQLKKLADGHGE